MQDRWAEHFANTAREYWTPERTRALIGDKRPAILPGDAPVLLRALGLLHRDGAMPPGQVRKYRQINHMIAALQPSIRALRDAYPTVRIIDAACGRSYVSTLLAWHFRNNWQHPVQILGVDRSPALVEESRRRTALIGLDDVLRFEASNLDDLDLDAAWARAFGPSVAGTDHTCHGLVSLHGCDTATDDALALAIRLRVPMVAVVPCCQAQLSAGWAALDDAGEAGAFAPLWGAPHLRRTTAAHVTDLMRMLLLRGAGYDASAIEFVPSEHTPKNTLIRGLLRAEGDPAAAAEYTALKAATGGVGVHLEGLLGDAGAPLALSSRRPG